MQQLLKRCTVKMLNLNTIHSMIWLSNGHKTLESTVLNLQLFNAGTIVLTTLPAIHFHANCAKLQNVTSKEFRLTIQVNGNKNYL